MTGVAPLVALADSPPEALDTEFLDYLAACEDEGGNWTVVAGEPREKIEDTAEKKPASPPRHDAIERETRP